ncbi:MAG TPA: arylesterase [Burkholderiales bacterium]|nr:arylesterase [Burkholderiales bacterium]
MRLVLLLTLCLIAAAPAPARAATPPVILIVGDSLSAGYGLIAGQGWVSLLQQRLKREGYGYRVVNASVSGETTDGGVQRLKRALDQHHPAIVVIELGGNDGLRGLPVSRVRTNLELLITKSRAAGAEVLLVSIRVPANYGQRYTTSFQGVYMDLANRYKIGLVPFLSDQVAVDLALFQADGIHPNAQAQPILLNNLWPKLSPLLQHKP